MDHLRNLAAPAAFLIEAQEAAGQRALVSNFDRLPKDFGIRKDFPRAALEALGFVIGGPVDDIFVAVTPPAGWTMVPTEHSMWSDVLDDRGRKRAAVFYKAAFYDRKAHFRLLSRYTTNCDYKDAAAWEDGERCEFVIDSATGSRLFDAGWAKNKDFKDHDKQDRACLDYLDREFPNHTDPLAYW